MTPLKSIDDKQRLYVIRCSGGFSCLGFDACEERKRALARELGQTLDGLRVGTRGAYTEYCRLVRLASRRHRETGWRSESELTEQLKGLEGWRVAVVDRWNQSRKFIVGRSTGFIPCHLELARRDSSGGPAVVGAPFKSLRKIERVR
jgi:hypothetical protein